MGEDAAEGLPGMQHRRGAGACAGRERDACPQGRAWVRKGGAGPGGADAGLRVHNAQGVPGELCGKGSRWAGAGMGQEAFVWQGAPGAALGGRCGEAATSHLWGALPAALSTREILGLSLPPLLH